MPNIRHPDQRLLNLSMSEGFIRELDAGLEELGISNRSDFIRQAIAEKLQRLGIEVPREMVTAPARAGKGGRPRLRPRAGAWPEHEPQGMILNDAPVNSTADARQLAAGLRDATGADELAREDDSGLGRGDRGERGSSYQPGGSAPERIRADRPEVGRRALEIGNRRAEIGRGRLGRS